MLDLLRISTVFFLELGRLHHVSHYYVAPVPNAPSGVTKGERANFSTRRGVVEQWWSLLGPLVTLQGYYGLMELLTALYWGF